MSAAKSGWIAGVLVVAGLGIGIVWWTGRSSDESDATTERSAEAVHAEASPGTESERAAGGETPAADKTASEPGLVTIAPAGTEAPADAEVKAVASATATGRVTGRVYGSGDRLVSAEVELHDAKVPEADLVADSVAPSWESRNGRAKEGPYEFKDVPPGEYRVVAEHESTGLRAMSVVVEVAAGQTTEVDLALPDGIVLFGRVYDDDDSPRVGAHVSVRGEGGVYAASETGADGSYEIEGLEAGRYQIASLYMPASGRAPAPLTKSIVIPEGVGRFEANLGDEEKGRLTLTARVTRGGEPVADHLVQMRYVAPDRAAMLVFKNSNTDEDGRFRIAGVFPGPVLFVIAEKPQRGRPGGRPELFEVVLPDRDTHHLDLKFPENRVVGRLANATGGARTGRVALRPSVTPGEPSDPMLSTRTYSAATDDDGNFAFERVAAGRYVLTAIVEATEEDPSIALAPPPVEVFEGETDLGTFVADSDACRVRVVVRDAEGRPIERAFVAVRKDGALVSGVTTLTDGEGVAALEAGLAPGVYDIEVESAGRAAVRAASRVVEGDEIEVAITMHHGGTLRVEVMSEGDPVESAAVEVLDLEGRPFPDARGSRFLRAATTGEDRTDVTGACRYERVAPGTYRVRVTDPERRTQTAEVVVRDGEESVVRLSIDP